MEWRELPGWWKGFLSAIALSFVLFLAGIGLLAIGGFSEEEEFGVFFLILGTLGAFAISVIVFSLIGYFADRKNEGALQPDNKTWEGTLSLVFGIVSLIIAFIPAGFVIGFPLACVGMIASRAQQRHNPTGVATAGFIVSIISVVLTILMILLGFFLFAAIESSGTLPGLSVK